MPADPPAFASGAIVLAAYRPDDALFARQLQSIKEQTVTDFRVIVISDGSADEVRRAVALHTGGDNRFDVIGAEDRVGFYRNFERGLRAVPAEVDWVALSDQDDQWEDDKLERMLPHLATADMVGAQARIVRYPSGEVLQERTSRQNISGADLPAANQFTGGMSVMRRRVLDMALPFPPSSSPAAVHDHWLAVCASVGAGAVIISDVVQDYVQHGGNVFGESTGGVLDAAGAWGRLVAAARADGRVPSVTGLAAAAFGSAAGWAEVMADAVFRRRPFDPQAVRLQRLYGSSRSFWALAVRMTTSAVLRRIPMRNALVMLVGSAMRPLARRYADENSS